MAEKSALQISGQIKAPRLNFAKAIDQALSRCRVLLVIIGPGWVDAVDHGGRRRLDDPRDLARLEIDAALKRGIRVIPMLVGGARLLDRIQEVLLTVQDRVLCRE